MPKVMKFSEAASLAIHAMVLLATNPEKVFSTKEIASILHASEAHLSKVLQRLTRCGLVKSNRGPKGGFILAKSNERITLLEVFEAIEGPLLTSECLLDTPVCGGEKCIFGQLLENAGQRFREYMASTRLSEVTGVFKREETYA
jgi:Rrf2 family nitric oxide-sensitive transcriptional repressor